MIKRALTLLVLALAVAAPLHADFAAVARAIDGHQGVKRIWIPFLGVARALVRVVEPQGVHDFQLVTFEGAGKVDPHEMHRILRAKVGPGFRPLVQVWSKKSGEWSFIYAKPSARADRFELILLVHDRGNETVLVRVDVDANVLARELGNPRNVTRVAAR